jgi:hypothetical protein
VTEPTSYAAIIAVRLAEELQHVAPIRDSAWLTVEVVNALDRLIDQGVIVPGRNLREAR